MSTEPETPPEKSRYYFARFGQTKAQLKSRNWLRLKARSRDEALTEMQDLKDQKADRRYGQLCGLDASEPPPL